MGLSGHDDRRNRTKQREHDHRHDNRARQQRVIWRFERDGIRYRGWLGRCHRRLVRIRFHTPDSSRRRIPKRGLGTGLDALRL
jgi:hypothetical protein